MASDNVNTGAVGGAATAKSDGAKADADVRAKQKPGAADALAGSIEEAGVAKVVRKKMSRTVTSGIAHINATFNNTQVAITDMKGAVLGWSSSGRMGFKGTRKSTAYAATVVAQDAARQVLGCKMQELEVRVQGPGAGRESAIRALQAAGFTVSVIKDVTPIPHNGCRARKRRRV